MSTVKEFQKFRKFMQELPYKHKIVIPGNHDFGLEPETEVYKELANKFGTKEKEKVEPQNELKKLKEVCTVLMHEMIEIEGLKIFGSPYVVSDRKMGFTYPPEKGEAIWSNLPEDIDILVTHCPPFGVHDVIKGLNIHGGCKALLNAVQHINPKVHIFGHIHESFGASIIGPTKFYNVGFLDEHYTVKNKPVLIEIEVPLK